MPVPKPGNRESCGRKGILHKNTSGAWLVLPGLALIRVAAAAYRPANGHIWSSDCNPGIPNPGIPGFRPISSIQNPGIDGVQIPGISGLKYCTLNHDF